MSGKKYVPDGVWLTCSCGTCYSVFKIMFHKKTDIYGSNMATEGDRWPFLNIKPMGLCSSKLSLCVPSPVLWKDYKQGIMIGGNQMLLEDSTAMCMFGGTIQIHFTLEAAQAACPFGSLKRPSEYIKDGFDWVFENMNGALSDLRGGLANAGAPNWLLNGVDQLAWNAQFSVGIVEGAINAVVGLGEVVWDIASDPVGIGTAIVEGVADGATKARDWMMDGENWKNAAESSWDYVTSPDKWAETAKDAAAWVQDNPRTLGNVTGEIAETALEVALTAGAATAAKKVTTEAAERAVREATERAAREAAEKAAKEAAERAAREVAEDGVQKSLPKVITKEKPLYKDLGKVEPCFLHGTLISTISGLKPIELIDQKDTVIVFDFETRTFATKNVVQKFKNWAMTYFIIDTDSGDSIKATGKHLFWLENERKWKIAKKLGCGDVLKTPSGLISVTDVVRIDNVEVDTFNLEVQDCHNYLVGMNGILVHNKSKPSKFESKTTKEIKIYEVYDPGPPEKVKYVGQTDKPSVGDRFKEHKTEGRKKGNHKKNWEKYRVREVKRGHWTPYEASVWEQHYIEKNGGKTNLQNVRNEITQKKYDRYAGQHNPCK